MDVLSLDCNGNTSNDLLSLPTLERDGVGQHRLSPGIHPFQFTLWCLEVMGMDNVISVLRIVIEIVDDNS